MDLDARITPLRRQVASFARRQPGCQALHGELYGVGTLVAAIIWTFLGDARRFSSSAQATRYAGLDVTVHASAIRLSVPSPPHGYGGSPSQP